jgi:putative two-component system response regulator
MPEIPITCLLVDDHEGLRTAVARGLSAFDWRCLQAANGVQALELLERDAVDIVISDIRMPEMDGVVLLDALRERHPDVAIIMVTGVSDVDTAVGCLRHGAYDYIVKPFQIEQLHVRVLQALEKRRLLLENRRYQLHLTDLVEQQAARIEELFLEGIQAIVHALEAKDPYTQGHSARVAVYAATTARHLGLDDETIQLVEVGAELHDVGKIGVSEVVLNKPGPLTVEEYRHVMQHTVIGARILEPLLKNARPALEIVRWHHERLDGTGHPDQLVGDAIPLHARVVSVVDAFDAMTTGRAYRKSLTSEAAIEELRANAGSQFDDAVVEAFVAAYPDRAALPIVTPFAARRSLARRASGSMRMLEGTA